MIGLLRVVSSLLLLFIVLISLRIFQSWFQGPFSGKPLELLNRVTDPILAPFARLSFLRQGAFDFSPMAAILTLVICLDLVNALILLGRITVGLVLGTLLSATWSITAFFLLMFMLLTALRAGILLLSRNPFSSYGRLVEGMVRPVVNLATRVFPSRRPLEELPALALTFGVLLALRLLGGLLVRGVLSFLYALPF